MLCNCWDQHLHLGSVCCDCCQLLRKRRTPDLRLTWSRWSGRQTMRAKCHPCLFKEIDFCGLWKMLFIFVFLLYRSCHLSLLFQSICVLFSQVIDRCVLMLSRHCKIQTVFTHLMLVTFWGTAVLP